MQIKNRQKLLAIVAVSSLVLLAGDSLVITPLTKSWDSRQNQIKELTTRVENGQKTLDRRAVIESRWEHMRTNTFPGNTTLAANAMYRAFDRWSQDSHVTVSSLKPQWKQTDDDYITLECRADATGSIEMISRFIYEAEKDPLALKVEAIEISSHDTNGQQLSLGLQVSGLLLNPQE